MKLARIVITAAAAVVSGCSSADVELPEERYVLEAEATAEVEALVRAADATWCGVRGAPSAPADELAAPAGESAVVVRAELPIVESGLPRDARAVLRLPLDLVAALEGRRATLEACAFGAGGEPHWRVVPLELQAEDRTFSFGFSRAEGLSEVPITRLVVRILVAPADASALPQAPVLRAAVAEGTCSSRLEQAWDRDGSLEPDEDPAYGGNCGALEKRL